MASSKTIHGISNRVARLAPVIFIAACLAGGLAVQTARAEELGHNQLQNIDVTSLPGDRVQLKLHLSDSAPKPLSFVIQNPARIAIDLPDTRIALKDRYRQIGVGVVESLATAEAKGRTRVVINLSDMVNYSTQVRGDDLYVTLGGAEQTEVAETAKPFSAPPESASASSAVSGGRSISNIDFRRGDNGAGRILVDLSDPHTPVNVQQQGDKIVVDFRNTDIADKLVRRLDVRDFATPVNTIDTYKRNGDTEMVIGASGDYDQIAYQADNKFTVEFKPLTKEEKAAQEKKVYTGQRLTLNFQDIETRAVLQIIADFTGLNIVVSDSVQGNVTLRLQNVPWDQALDIILKTKGLDTRTNGNVMLVAPAAEIAAREEAELKAKQQMEELAPLRSDFIQINYAKATDLAQLLKSQDNTLMSKRGKVTVDTRTNTLLIQDTEDRLSQIRKLINRLDVPVRQVQIESRIVIANNDFSRDLGVRFGVTGARQNGNDGLVSISGSAEGTDTMTGSAISNINSGGNPLPVTTPSLGDRLNVNLPTDNPAGRVALAILNSDYLVDLELSAMQAEGQGEVVSSPRVITANQKEASIEQGVEIPYQQSSSSGATNTQFKKAVLSLKVTPQITPDDRVIMDLAVNKDSIGQEVASAQGGRVPSIDTRKVNTQVLVDNGQTVVLGGIFETTRRTTTSKVPLLGDLPGLGALFRSTRKTSNKDELLIFVTPRILKQGATLNQ